MSISIITQPASTLLSAGNDNISTISGTTLNAANVFEYKFIADIYVNGILQVTLKSFPDPTYGFGVFNTRNILTSFISFDFFATDDYTNGLMRNCPNSSCRAQLVYGEEYTSGNTFIQNRNLASGNTAVYFNGSLSYPDEVNTSLSAYTPRLTGARQLMLTKRTRVPLLTFSMLPLNMFTNERQFVYFANNPLFSGGAIQSTGISISTFSKPNLVTQIGQYTIPSNLISGNTASDIQAFAVGYQQIASLTSGNVQALFGTFPIITPSVQSIEISVSYVLTSGTTGAEFVLGANILVDCGRFAAGAYTISWLNELGGFDSWLFNKKNETTQNNQRQSYKKQQGSLNANGSYSLNTYSRSEVPYYTVLKDSIVMYTDFLGDNDVLFLKSLISSPAVFMTDQNGLTTSILIKDGSYRINKVVNQKIYSLEMTVEQSYNDYRQIL